MKRSEIYLLILFVVVVAGLAMNNFAMAQVEEVFLANTSDDPRNVCAFLQIIVNIKNFALIIGGPITVLMIIIGGLMRTASSGNQNLLEQSKKVITSGIIGLIIVLCAWLIVGGVLSALYGRDLGSAWWQIEGCNAVDTGPEGQPGADEFDGISHGTGFANKEECRNFCGNDFFYFNEERGFCSCHQTADRPDPSDADSESECDAYCMPKGYTWNNEEKICVCRFHNEFDEDENAVHRRISDTAVEFLWCMERAYLPPSTATIYRIGDPNDDCYDEDGWNETDCLFEKRSCHYGCKFDRGQSYAIDFNNVSHKEKFALDTAGCGGTAYDKGSYIHARIYSDCSCSNKDE